MKFCYGLADPPFIAQETLRAWQKKNHPWLELSDVHRETTEGVRVTVIPFYMGSRETQNSAVYWVSHRTGQAGRLAKCSDERWPEEATIWEIPMGKSKGNTLIVRMS